MTDAVQIITTTSDRQSAAAIGQALVQRRLVACAQVSGPITSYYHWQGQLEQSEEWVCLVKTLADRYAAVEATIRELHSYEVPQIVAVPIVSASQSYLAWLRDELQAPPSYSAG